MAGGVHLNIIGYGTATVENTALALTSTLFSTTLPARARRAFLTCETNNMRWRADGTSPTKTEGHVFTKDTSLSFMTFDHRQLLEAMTLISATTASGAHVKVTYFD